MELITELKDIMERCGYSQPQVARAMGISPATINQFLKGKYAGDNDKVSALVESFARREREKLRAKRIHANFVETEISLKGLQVVSYAHEEGEICVLSGAAGLGKTMILQEYARRDQGVILIEADPGYTARVLLDEICRRLGIKKSGNIHDLCEECVKALKGSTRLLMIDEAELLPYRALEVLRRLHDKTGIGIVLAGMPRLIVNLKGNRGEYAQLYSRVALALSLDDALTREDFDPLARNMMTEANDQTICDTLYREASGNARRLFKLVKGTYSMCRNSEKPVSVKAIEKFSKMLIH